MNFKLLVVLEVAGMINCLFILSPSSKTNNVTCYFTVTLFVSNEGFSLLLSMGYLLWAGREENLDELKPSCC